ncbi:thiolase family protein [Pseudorhodoplanes sp.]|uniref:thiolase family protein n=1 Tax=Pseudorhodoplanes sp. TaxID=1934341 RepID=UPI003D0BABE8
MANAPALIPLVAGGMVGPFGRFTEQSLVEIARPVLEGTLKDTGIAATDVQAAFVGNAFGGAIVDQESIMAQALLAPAGIRGVPMQTVKNACSSGSSAVHLAWSAIAYGQYDCVLVLGAERLTHADKRRSFAALATATDHKSVDENRSVFMDVNAARANRYMERYGATQRHFAQVAAKNRAHAVMNERASLRTPITVDEVLNDRVIVPPLTRAMCGGVVDGAACVVLVSPAFARKRGLSHTSRVVASGLVSGLPEGDESGNATARAGHAAYAQGGIDPKDIAVAEVHDASAPQELFDIEDLMLCDRGEAIRLLEDGDITLGGRMPVNVSGGLTSRGHPVGATGVAQIVEVHEQLMGRAGARQAGAPKVGLAQMAGGLLGQDSAVATAHILTV